MPSRWINALLAAAFLCGCAAREAAGPADPAALLSKARTLYAEKDKPADAERTLRKAIDAFSAQGNQKGLADSYHQYAYLLSSPAVAKEAAAYRKNGFLDKSVTFENRLQRAVDYFDRAAPIYARLKRFDKLTENSLGRGIVYANMGRRDEACAEFDQAESFQEESAGSNPNARPPLPKGQGTWEGYLASLKKWAGCGG